MNAKEKLKGLYLVGAVSACIVIILTVLDIIAGSSTGGDLTMIPVTASDNLALIRENKLSGLYYLDLLNLIVSVIFIPVFFAIYLSLRNDNEPFALFALIIFITGTTVFISNNAALAMFDLSRKLSLSEDPARRAIIASAGEALLAKGSHGSPGVFPGFFLVTVSELLISVAMLRGIIYSKATAWFGITGTLLLIIYLILVTFVPELKERAMLIAAPGGILSLVWMILFSLRLFRLSSK